jgi:predicted nucleic acid-binding protein
MSDRTFFDTNVLVYLFDADSPGKRDRARQVFGEQTRSGRIVLSAQVLQELYVTITRKLARPLPAAEALSVLAQLSTLPLITVDGALILRAVELHQQAGLSFWDGLIVQAALEGRCRILLSEDMQHGRKFGDLTIRNPFLH